VDLQLADGLPTHDLPDRMRQFRAIFKLSHRDLGILLGKASSTIETWERGDGMQENRAILTLAMTQLYQRLRARDYHKTGFEALAEPYTLPNGHLQ
jgi:hypothetical protein